MKKMTGLFLVSALVLGACGNNDNSERKEKKEDKKSEVKK